MTEPSRKELARRLRKQAYQKARERWAIDPRRLAMKEAAKLRRKELYRQYKERRDASENERKARHKVERAAALMTMLSRGT